MKFLEEYADRQALIWKIFSKHQNIPDKISNLHLHIDDFKGNIQKEFNFLKEATRKNIKNFQASLSSQQTYSVALGSHINNIYHKISELQQQLPHPTQHMNTGDIIQINTPEFDLDIDSGPSTKEHREIQGSDNPIQHYVVLLHCGCLSLNPFIEISIRNNSSSSDVLNIQASISISPKFESK